MSEADLYANLSDQLQACVTQEERDWVALRFNISQLPEPLRAAVQAAAVPRFFDRAFLNALLEQPLDEAQFAELTGLSYIEPYPGEGRFNIHERSRKLLQEKLWQENEELYREISRRAFAYCKKQDQNNLTWRIETVYHQLVAESDEGAIVLNNTCVDWMNQPHFSYNKAERLLLAVREQHEMQRLSEESSHCQFVLKIVIIRHAVARLWQDVKKNSILYRMPCGPAHAECVEDIIHRLIPAELDNSLLEIEKYYLVVAALTHDIGVISDIDIGKECKLYPEQIRENYHRRSEQYIVNNYGLLAIDEIDYAALGILALFHHRNENLEYCPEYFVIGNETVRLRLLAAYLRLAHALANQLCALSSEYAACLAYDTSYISKLDWIKSRLVSGIEVMPSDRRILVYFKLPHDGCLLGKEILQEDDMIFLQQHLTYLQQGVLDELREVLDSVKNTLIRGGITWYLDIESVSTQVEK